MATVKDALEAMRKFAPEDYAFKQEYDNVGLIVGKSSLEIKKIMCCLDVTDNVIEQAIKVGAGLIVSHHPMIYYPVQTITDGDVLGRKLLKAIANNISVYSAHTNLDFVKDGINDYMASLFGLRNVTTLDPYISAEEGVGRVGDLGSSMFCTVLKAEVETVLKDNYVRIVGEPTNQVKRVAIINGGGGGDVRYVDMAIKAGADCLITADVKHHVAMYALESGITLIEPQHYTMEHAYISRLIQILKIEFKSRKLDLEVLQAVENNPRF